MTHKKTSAQERRLRHRLDELEEQGETLKSRAYFATGARWVLPKDKALSTAINREEQDILDELEDYA